MLPSYYLSYSPADEVTNTPRLTSDWFVAASAEGAPLGVVVGFAVGHALVVEERTPAEGLVAVLRKRGEC